MAKPVLSLEDKLKSLPDKPGVYIMKDSEGNVLYVGKASSLRNRVHSYFQKGQTHSPRIERMVGRVADFDLIVTDNEVEALILEATLIKQYKPRFNIRLRDDKQYPWIQVTAGEEFPRVFFVRQPARDEHRYFGPYPSSQAVYQTIALIRQVFGLATCKLKFTKEDRLKPCLYYHIHQCVAPCAGYITPEEYRKIVNEVLLFLEGKETRLIQKLRKQMEKAAEALRFEEAARLRDQIKALEKIQERQKVVAVQDTEQDIIGFAQGQGQACLSVLYVRAGKLLGQEQYFLDTEGEASPEEILQAFLQQYYTEKAQIPKEILLPFSLPEKDLFTEWLSKKAGRRIQWLTPLRGEKRRFVEMANTNAETALQQVLQKVQDQKNRALAGLEALQSLLDLPSLPSRIEAYDISNFQGSEAVGSMVVFRDGRPQKEAYRRFKIKGLPPEPNDFQMIQQVFRRRLEEGLSGNPKFLPFPDLVLIDGGKGQLNAALEVLEETGLNIPILALAKQFEEVYVPGSSAPLDISGDNPGLLLLMAIRDEAHRFAVTFHRKLRGKVAMVSLLDQIPGIGKARRTALLKHFGSLEGVKSASLEELASCPGMNRKVAEIVYRFLHLEEGVPASSS